MSYGNGQGGNGNVAQQYLRQQIEQASSIEQVLMLYDGAMRFLLQAKSAIERGEIEARCNANRRAMQIIAYLLDMVNPETGGDAAKGLFRIYTSLLKRMMMIDFENNAAVCEEVVVHLRALRGSMAQAVAVQRQATTAPATSTAGAVVAAPKADSGVPEATRRDAVA
jgi:flagellar protein FliS